MSMKKLLLCLFALDYTFQETNGHIGYCGIRTPVVDICTKSEAILELSVFIDTVKVPYLPKNPCKCTISPVSSTIIVLLSIIKFSPANFNMEYKLNDITLNRTILQAMTTLSEITEMVLETPTPFKTEGSCVMLSTADGSKFNITCEGTVSNSTLFPVTNVTESTFAYSTYEQSTLSTTVSVEDNTNIRSVNEDGVNIGVIGPAIGGAVGFIGLIIVIVICYKRKSSSKKHTTQVKTSQNDTQEHMKNDEDDDDDYYMTENPMYNLTDTPQYTPVTNTEDDFIETNEGNNRHLSDHYETLPDSPNDVNVPLTQTEEDQGDSFTATPEVVQDTGNDYHIIGEVKDDKSYPSNQHI